MWLHIVVRHVSNAPHLNIGDIPVSGKWTFSLLMNYAEFMAFSFCRLSSKMLLQTPDPLHQKKPNPISQVR